MQDPFYFEAPEGKEIPLFDSHCHLQYPDFDHDRQEVIQRAKESGLSHIICIGTNLEDSLRAIALAQANPEFITATIGNHPYQADQSTQNFTQIITENRKFIAGVGETGLDYFRSPIDKLTQQKSFAEHCQLSVQFDLPIIIHLREFEDCIQDALNILQEYKVKKAVFHCYTGSLEYAQKIWQLGYKTSFGLITNYPKNTSLKAVYQACPPHLKLHETDAPYLPPASRRGERNEPSFIPPEFS